MNAMLEFLSNRRLDLLRVALAVVEGVAIGFAVRRSIVPVVGFYLILTANRLRLESRLP